MSNVIMSEAEAIAHVRELLCDLRLSPIHLEALGVVIGDLKPGDPKGDPLDARPKES